MIWIASAFADKKSMRKGQRGITHQQVEVRWAKGQAKGLNVVVKIAVA